MSEKHLCMPLIMSFLQKGLKCLWRIPLRPTLVTLTIPIKWQSLKATQATGTTFEHSSLVKNTGCWSLSCTMTAECTQVVCTVGNPNNKSLWGYQMMYISIFSLGGLHDNIIICLKINSAKMMNATFEICSVAGLHSIICHIKDAYKRDCEEICFLVS